MNEQAYIAYWKNASKEEWDEWKEKCSRDLVESIKQLRVFLEEN